MSSIVTRCGHGMTGCEAPTDDERVQDYAGRLQGRFDPHGHARRGAEGLALVAKLRALWRRLDRLKRKTTRKAKPKPKQTNIVPIRRRA